AISDGTSIKGSEEGPSTYFNSAPYKKLKKCLPNKFQEFIHTKPLSKIAVPPTFEPIQFPADIINKKITLKYRPATPFDNVLQNCRMLAIDVAASIAANQKFITIGGDHSMAIGTWSG